MSWIVDDINVPFPLLNVCAPLDSCIYGPKHIGAT